MLLYLPEPLNSLKRTLHLIEYIWENVWLNGKKELSILRLKILGPIWWSDFGENSLRYERTCFKTQPGSKASLYPTLRFYVRTYLQCSLVISRFSFSLRHYTADFSFESDRAKKFSPVFHRIRYKKKIPWCLTCTSDSHTHSYMCLHFTSPCEADGSTFMANVSHINELHHANTHTHTFTKVNIHGKKNLAVMCNWLDPDGQTETHSDTRTNACTECPYLC